MTEVICPKCGLPKSLCVCETIEREARVIKVYVESRRFGKPMTIVEGIDEKAGKNVAKQLKRKLACGGTFKNGRIELQGNHVARVKEILKEMGYEEEQIEVS